MQIFNSVPPNIITEKFTDAGAFTQACSKLLVTEVRRRASNQSTEQAAGAIASFLEVNLADFYGCYMDRRCYCHGQEDSSLGVAISVNVASNLSWCWHIITHDMPHPVLNLDSLFRSPLARRTLRAGC